MSDPLDRTPQVAGDAEAGDPGSAAAHPDVASAPGRRTPRAVTMPMLGAVAALALAAALGAWYATARMERELRLEVAQRLAGVESSTQTAGKAQAQLAADLRDAQAKIALLEARIAESQAQQAALEALYRDLAPSRDEIALSEIEQVLVVANQQLQLAGNVSSALTALQLADAKLQRLDRPQFVALRRALTRDIDELKAVPFVDVTGMTLKLDQALAAIDTLPLAMDERLPPPAPEPLAAPGPEPWWSRLLRDMWADVKQLIRIEVADRPAAPLVPVAQEYFLRENLRLRLLSARIALLGRDDASFQADLAAAGNWVKQYFDTRAKTVQSFQATIRQLAATPMPSQIPDLTRSLEAARVLRLAQDRAQDRAPARAQPAPKPR